MAKERKTPAKSVNGPGSNPRGGFQKPKNTKKTVRRLLHYIGTHPVMLIVAVVCVIASALANVAGTYVMRPIINNITAAVAAGQTNLPELGSSVFVPPVSVRRWLLLSPGPDDGPGGPAGL